MVAVIQLALALGANVGGLLFDPLVRWLIDGG
jgi:predicted MFS family arabinose efflux permease